MKPVPAFSALVFFIISIAHLVRFVLRVPVTAGTVVIPQWPSAVIFVALLFLGVMLLRESKR